MTRAPVVVLSVVLLACAAAQVGSYEAAQDACITNAAAMVDASVGEKRASADACRHVVRCAWGRCDGGVP